ncbi:MAG: TIGR00701 family protein [Alphaproteobacteria bacterium RIFOXYD12_FULL_60_8]|nr:MAG: TIGR00701 family protein [Alphaproteobacteria bacterium RIFOXYD12_FULL_60_8]
MSELIASWYDWIKMLHVLAVITWMAALFYLPRLFVYHAMETPGSATSETFKVMERKLQRGIMTPSLVGVLLTGIPLVVHIGWSSGWVHVKLTMVALMVVCHVLYSRWRLDFLHDRNTRPHTFYRLANEAPTLLLMVILIMVIVKPF